MAFQLESNESIRDSFARIVREQSDKAIESLRGDADSITGEAVHKIRKRLKRIRSVLRLARYGLPKSVYRHESRRFRDAGRPLSPLRDAAILFDTFERLIERFHNECARQECDAVCEALLFREQVERQRLLQHAETVVKVAKSVGKTLGGSKRRPLAYLNRTSLEKGLGRIITQGRSRLRKAANDPTVVNLHNWRKRVKDLAYALELLQPIPWPEIEALGQKTRTLAQALGDDHDLAGLQEMMTMSLNPHLVKAANSIVPLIDRRRSELQREAFDLGEQIYREEPREFAKQVGSFWKSWRQAARRKHPVEQPQAHVHGPNQTQYP